MTNVPGTDIEVTVGAEEPGALSQITDLVETAVTGIPASIRKNATAAFTRLCSAATDLPTTWLKGKANELKAESDARILLTNTAAMQIAAEMKVNPAFAIAASDKHAMKIIRKQLNADKVVEQAAETLRLDPPKLEEPVPDISEDWLNAFEDEASNMSSEQMQRLFGRILAGEIRKPSSFSIKTVKLMAQLDNTAAETFRRLCSMCISMQIGSHLLDARVPGLAASAASNSLQNYGLNFDQLNVLHEYGLIISDYNSFMGYGSSVVIRDRVQLPLIYLKQQWVLVPKIPIDTPEVFNVHGVALSRSGKELFPIVDAEPNDAYTDALTAFFDTQGKSLVRV